MQFQLSVKRRIENAERDLQECVQRSERLNAGRRELFKSLVGPLHESMFETREATERYLTHPDPKLRVISLNVMVDLWKPGIEFGNQCETMAFDDPDPAVRIAAVTCLALCYCGTRDTRIGNRLANAVRDDLISVAFRKSAYFGLFDVTGTSIDELPVPFHFRFPDDVDWSFVNGFLAGR